MLSLTLEVGIRSAAGKHPVESKMSKISAQFAPANQQHGVHIVDYRQRKYATLALIVVLVAIAQLELMHFTNRAAKQIHVYRLGHQCTALGDLQAFQAAA
jgi:hypothetical protein